MFEQLRCVLPHAILQERRLLARNSIPRLRLAPESQPSPFVNTVTEKEEIEGATGGEECMLTSDSS